MAGIVTLTDHEGLAALDTRPSLLLFTTGDGLRSEFVTAFKKAATEKTTVNFAQIDPTKNPQLAAHFEIGEKPVLVGYANGKTQVIRSRPWGADVVLTIEMLEKMKPELVEEEVPMTEEIPNTPVVVLDKPHIVSENSFKEDVIEYSNTMPVLVDFWAAWCGPCRQVAPIMEKLAKEFAGQIRIAKVDTDANQGISQAFRIMSIPTIMAFKDGQMVFNQAGAFPEPAFRDLVKQLIALDVQAAIAQKQPAQ